MSSDGPGSWELRSRRPLPGAVGAIRTGDLWRVEWTSCLVMGIVNVTPDSFSDGGDHLDPHAAIAHARRLVADGATIVDIGGESTRPGAAPVDAEQELARVLPVIEAMAADATSIVSIDTRKPAVAEAAIAAGAHLVNDVSGLRDPRMVEVCAALGVPAVVMHMRGDPTDMQHDPQYADVVAEVTDWLERQTERAIAAGVPGVVVDPGIGFGKTLDHNLALLQALPLQSRHPVLVGASRKRSVQLIAGTDDPRRSDSASIAVHLFAAQRGAAIVRVHDVDGHRQALAVDRRLRQR